MVPKELRYSKEHEWLKLEGGRGRIGITDFAQQSLGDVVFVELPEVGQKLTAGDAFGVVESVKAASDCYTPVAGTVVAVNEALLDDPQLINQEPYGGGWMMEVELADPAEVENLMTAEEYEKLTQEGGE
ncbi:glycine cleavage system protein H [Clostridiales bacterium PH28_bin88]|nr:glycine cleavage system protein H [Clostridiales bacterium PH28_bin88]